MRGTEGVLPDGPWLDRLNPTFLSESYPSWATKGGTFEVSADAFRQHGFPKLAAIDDGLQFDPEYFRDANPAWEGADDLDCYRDWLLDGIAAGRLASGEAHLRYLGLPLTVYPEAFPWRYYARLRPRAGANRWSALDDLCSGGFVELIDEIPFGPDASQFLCALGHKYSIHNDPLAIRAYELAQTHGPLPAPERQHLADAYLRLGFWRPALRLYDGITRDGQGTAWTVRNLVKCATKLEAWAELLAALDRERPRQSTDPLWDMAVSETVDGMFSSHARRARVMMANGAYVEAEGLLEQAVADLAALITTLESPRSSRESSTTRKVLILANEDDPESTQRRVQERLRLLGILDTPCESCLFTDLERYTATLPSFTAVFLFRVPALPAVIRFILTARRVGVPTFFESDVSLPDAQSTPPIESFRGKITGSHYDDLRFGTPLHRATARLCDFGIAPTERLAAAMRPLVRNRQCFVIPNSLLPDQTLDAGRPRNVKSVLRIFVRTASLIYVDATPGTIGRSLLTMLERCPDVTLCLSGPIHLDTRFDAHADKLVNLGYSPMPNNYWVDLARSDINLAIPCDSSEGEYRTEISWAEAAALAVPSVLVIPDGRLPGIQEGVNALRPSGLDAWLVALERLVHDAALRERLGTRAQRDVAAHQGLYTAVRALDHVLTKAATNRDDNARAD